MNVVINYCLDYTHIPVGEYDNTTHTVIGVLEVGTWAKAIFTDKQGFSQMWNDWVELLYSSRSSTAMFVKESEKKRDSIVFYMSNMFNKHHSMRDWQVVHEI